jgi:CHAT domain-containing protein/tetratricopeptide (TPR) repeat protein
MVPSLKCLQLVAPLAAILLVAGTARSQEEDARERCLAAYRRAEALWAKGQLAEAVKPYEQAVALAPSAFGAEHPTTGDLQNSLGVLYQELGQYDKAEPLLRSSLRLWEARLPANDLRLAQGLNNLAELYRRMGRYAEAEPLYRRSLKIKEAHDPKNPSLALGLNNLALLYQATGYYERALPLYQRSLKIFEERFGTDNPQLAVALDNLAQLYMHLGRDDRSEAVLRRSLKIFEDHHGPDHPDVAICLNNLAFLHHRQLGQLEQAEPLYRRCLRIQEDRLGSDHPNVAQTLTNLGTLYQAQGRYADAEPLLQRSLQIRKKRLPADHPDVAQSLSDLGFLYEERRQPERAVPLYHEAIKIEEGRDPNHPSLAQILTNLGILYLLQNDLEQAEPLLRRSLKIRETRLGPDHPDLSRNLGALALVCALTGRPDQEISLADRDLRILCRYARRVLGVQPEREQLTFLQARLRREVEAVLCAGMNGASEPRRAEHSAEWLLNGKALAQEVLAERMLLARVGDDPRLADLAVQLRAVRRQLSALTYRPPGARNATTWKQTMARLGEQEQDLSRRLGQAAGRPTAEEPWMSLKDVRRRLPADAVLIDIARLRYRKLAGASKVPAWEAPHYAAWLIPPAGRGDVRIIDLGEAGPIEDAVWAVRQALANAPRTIAAVGEADAEKELRQPLQALARHVLKPLRPHLDSARHWLISPDADLWLCPWGALPLPDGHYAVERYGISHLVSGRDLLRGGGSTATGPALVLADPDYDLAPGGAGAEAQGPPERPSADEGVSSRRASVARHMRWGRLPGTAAEARAIVPRLKEYTGASPRVYLGDQAREGVFKSARQPRVVVLSTHGFFREDQEYAPAQLSADRGLDLAWPDKQARRPIPSGQRAMESSLLRCGLVLAGANHRWEASEEQEDGVLTGLEITSTDLRGTELVVLSACETGLGQVHVGEGVVGLRQAFQLAGARSVVASLWKVPDRETAELMSAFFRHLVKGQDKPSSLCAAQRELMAGRRREHKAAHPFYWAAFTVTGQ